MNISNAIFCAALALLTSCTWTWDYDWDWMKPGGSGANFKQLSINDGNKNLSGGIHSVIVNGTTYQIAYSEQYLYFNNTGSQNKFNQTALGGNTIVAPITTQISPYYDSEKLLRFLFVNDGGTIYSCGFFNLDSVSCVTPPTFTGMPNQPTMVTGNNSYQYAVSTAKNPPNIYLAQNTGPYALIDNPNDEYSQALSQFSSITTDVNGNLYTLVTYGADNSSKVTYLDSYNASSGTWSKVLNASNLLAISTPMAVNSTGTVFFLNPNGGDSISCNNGEERIPVGYTKDGGVKIGYVVIDNSCSTAISVNQISIDSTNTIYISLSNSNVFYGTMQT
jgi:hypothetical protein